MRGVAKRFGATVAVEGVDFEVPGGEVHALVGENGAGKSTLMKILSGAVPADRGAMWLDGEPFHPRDPLHARRAGVAMIYQELSLAGHLSVMENILLGMEPKRLGMIRWRQVRQAAVDALAALEHPEIRPETPVRRLSVAAQQLVEVARALAVGCRVLVLDEPTSSLTQQDVTRLFSLIARLRARGQAIVYISHFLEEVRQVADRLTVLRDGRSVAGGLPATTSFDEIVAAMVGRKIESLYPRSPRPRGEPILVLDSLSGGERPREASLVLHRGEVLGIAGLVGAGRTELVRTIFGLDPFRSGTLRMGAFVGPASPTQSWMRGMGMLSEDRKEEGLAVTMRVGDNVALSSLRRLGRFGLVLPRRLEAAARQWIERLDIRCRGPRQTVLHLSGGNQQKVALARLLFRDVDVLLLDEPTRGIDVASKARVYQIIDELALGRIGDPPRPRAILMVSSYLPELLGVCDSIAVMCRGRLGPIRPVEEVDEHRLMLEATGT